MRRVILAFCVLLAAAPRAGAFWGRDKESLPDRHQTARKSLLWVPAAEALDWDRLNALLQRRKGARFTVAIAPEDIPEEKKEWLVSLEREGRLEIAVRIAGDPILPFAAERRPQLAAEKLAVSRLLHKKIFGKMPSGFAPGGGAITPGNAAPLARLGLRWVSVGEGEFLNPWYGDEQLVLIPFHAVTSTETLALPPVTATPALVIDEAAGTLAPGSGLAVLEGLYDAGGDAAYTTVSEALSEIRPYVVGPESWPCWAESLKFWKATETQAAAWSLLHEASRAIADYQNSGTASIARLNKAEEEMDRARAGRNFVDANLRNPEIEKGFREALQAAYRAIGEPVPARLSRRMAAPGARPEPNTGTPPPPDEDAGAVTVETAARGLVFRNPEASLAALPAVLPELEEGSTAQAYWTPRSIGLAWNDRTVDFTIGLSRLEGSDDAPYGFAHLLVDVYVDLNHLSGRGSTELLPHRNGFIDADDAWEYALSISGWESGIYRSLSGHPPSRVAELDPEVDLDAGTIKVSVPRRLLRGNPAAWGYLVATMSGTPDSLAQQPPRPEAGETGSPLLGMLGSLDEQRSLVSTRKSTFRRFKAQRASPPAH